jgi:hypothetical protein
MGGHQARKVSSIADVLSAAADVSVREIRVTGPLASVPTLRLAPGQTLVGEGTSARLAFAAGVDGVQLSRDNAIKALSLATDVDRRAVFNDTGQSTLGRSRTTVVPPARWATRQSRGRCNRLLRHADETPFEEAKRFIDRPGEKRPPAPSGCAGGNARSRCRRPRVHRHCRYCARPARSRRRTTALRSWPAPQWFHADAFALVAGGVFGPVLLQRVLRRGFVGAGAG